MIIFGILLFALLVVVHEFGHFIAARRSGVDVEEFGIGFPPKLFGKKLGKHKTLYSFNLIPLGGFVRLKGETDSDKSKSSFGSVSLRKKAKILLAGVGMNVVAVYVILLVLALVSLPKVLPNQFSIASNEKDLKTQVLVTDVSKDSAAASIGMVVGDEVLQIDGQQITSTESLHQATAARPNKTVEVIYRHKNEQKVARATLADDNGEGRLGVVPLDATSSRYTWSAPLVAAGATLQMLWLTLSGIVTTLIGFIAGIFTRADTSAATEAVTGPVGVFFLMKNIGSFGLEYLLVLIASISASLAVVNALPIPALDGGRLALIVGARGLKKKLSPQFENAVHSIGFMVLIGLIILISYVDVRRFF